MTSSQVDTSRCLCCGGAVFSRLRAYRTESPAGRRLFRNSAIHKCVACGLCQLFPVPDNVALTNYYASSYRAGRRYGADAANAATFPRDNLFFYNRGRSITALVRRHLRQRERPLTILDIGAGFGHILHALGEAYPSAVRLAHEYSDPCIEHLRAVGIRVVTGDLADALRSLPQVDLVVISHVLEHLRNPVETLALVRERMAPDALLYVEVPHMGEILLSGYPDSPWAPRHDEPHITFFDTTTLGRVLEAAGFTPQFLETAGPAYHDVSALRYHLPPLLPTLRRIVPPAIRRQLQRAPTAQASLDHLAPEFDKYGGKRIWLRSISQVAAGTSAIGEAAAQSGVASAR
jgi:SAM-dependent methyltransferase